MSDKLISQYEEGNPASGDWLLYEQANTPGLYLKVQKANVGSGGGGGGATTLSTPTLSVAGIDADTIRATIGAVANESSIELQRSNDGSTGWTTIGGSLPADTTSYDDNGLPASTTRYYRVRAVGNGTTFLTSGWSSVVNASTTAGGGGVTYLTWAGTLDTDLELFNSNQGIRKKASATDAWGDNIAVSTQTIAAGEELIFSVPVLNKAFIVGLASAAETSAFGNTDIKFGFYANNALGVDAAPFENGMVAYTGPTLTAGNLLKIKYATGVVTYEYSTNGGTSWTTISTPANNVPSGTYLVHFEAYSTTGGPDVIYKKNS